MRPCVLPPVLGRCGRGLTVVELLVALSLATMLVVAVLGMLTLMESHRRVLTSQVFVEPWQYQLSRQLRRDLTNARQMKVDRDRLVLTGYSGTNGLGLLGTSRLAEVTYQVARIGDDWYLLRDERSLDSLFDEPNARHLIADGIHHIEAVDASGPTSNGTYVGLVPPNCRIAFFRSGSPCPAVEIKWSR